jgi:hypothetical protein
MKEKSQTIGVSSKDTNQLIALPQPGIPFPKNSRNNPLVIIDNENEDRMIMIKCISGMMHARTHQLND